MINQDDLLVNHGHDDNRKPQEGKKSDSDCINSVIDQN